MGGRDFPGLFTDKSWWVPQKPLCFAPFKNDFILSDKSDKGRRSVEKCGPAGGVRVPGDQEGSTLLLNNEARATPGNAITQSPAAPLKINKAK